MMKKKFFNLALLIFSAALTFGTAFYNFAVSRAQTTDTAQRTRQAPTATPTPVLTPIPPPPPLPIEEDDIIKVDTELVNLNVRVVDRNNRSIASLQQNEFKIFEDGVEQQIEFFSKGEVPTNYSLVIDNSNSLRSQLEKVIEAGKILINTNRPDDETSIIRFVSSDKIEILQDFTPKKDDLDYALENLFTEGGQTAIIDAVYLAAERVDNYEKARDSNDRKRRALILISDGEDRNSFYSEQQLFKLLRESDVQIFVIGFVNELDDDSGLFSKSVRGKAKNLLERLATETGGKSYFPGNVNELNTIARDIATELRTQYSIGYVPTNDKKDGSFRNIKVVVADGPNKQKRIAVTRSGRTSESNNPPPQPSLQNTTQKRTN